MSKRKLEFRTFNGGFFKDNARDKAAEFASLLPEGDLFAITCEVNVYSGVRTSTDITVWFWK